MAGKIRRVLTNIHIDNILCKRNKNFPNSQYPVLIYRHCLELPKFKNKAVEIVQKIFARNKWSNSWQNGIYDFHHYHSTTHECMAIVQGKARVIFGGPKGKPAEVITGDVIILPAGTGHKCTKHSDDFLCVGAYPQAKDYDTNYGKASEYDEAVRRIKTLSIPLKDPVFGNEGFLKSYWK
jgi:uncharacterized protein YjlB